MSLLKTEAAHPVYGQEPATIVADVIAAFFRGKRMIVGAILLFVVLVTALSVLGGKTYESHMMFLVRNEGSTFPTSLEDHPEAQLQSASDTQIGTEIELLNDAQLHRQVISALHPGMSSTAIDHQLLSFDKSLQVVPIPKTSLIGVTYTGSSPENANATLATLSTLYLDYRSKIRGSEGAYEFFDKQAKAYSQTLQDDQAKLAGFNQKYQVTLMNEEKDVTVRRLADAQALLYENKASLGEAERKIQAMVKARENLPPRIVTQRRDLPDQAGAGHFSSILADLQNERVALLTKYHATDRHVQEVDEKIANIREALKRSQQSTATEEATDLNPIRQSVDTELQQTDFRFAGLQARQRSLATQVAAYNAKLEELNQVTAQYDNLTRRIKDDEATYELYVNKREGARINKTLDNDKIANVRQVSGPEIVQQPGTKLLLSLFCFYVIGSLLIAGVGILAGLWSRCFHSPSELEAAVGFPVLATIPLLADQPSEKVSNRLAIAIPSAGRKVSNTRSGDSIQGRAFLQDLNLNRSDLPVGQLSRYVAGIHSDGAQPGGVYLPLIERLRRADPSHPGAGSVFAFTSCNRGEGVSHFVRGLGAELTEYTGKKVAIVNALDSYGCGVENDGMLPTELPATAAKSGEEFLKQWFQKLRINHDYVLIDCPALSVSHAAAVFGPQSDGLLLVVAAGKATRSQLRGALAMLSLASVAVLGLALNKRQYPIPSAIYNLL